MSETYEAHFEVGTSPPVCECHNEPISTQLLATDPLEHPEWDSLVLANYRGGSLFHSSIWARVLHKTYGHEPVYFCQLSPGKLRQLLPVMEISSRLTGRHGVSLPFTDVCVPLSGPEDKCDLYEAAMKHGRARGWRYLECRGGNWEWPGASPSLEFWGHLIDLDRSEEVLFQRLGRAARRGVRKAKRCQLQVEFSNDPEAMKGFYQLHCATRRRHGVPPQPWLFFENIAELVVGAGHGFVVTARSEKRPVAAAVFFHFGREALYKFGASEHAFQHLRPNNLVFWEAIKRYAAAGFAHLHLGRTSLTNQGLRRFKLGFGASEEKIQYFRYDFRKESFIAKVDRSNGWLNPLFRRLPLPVLRFVGAMVYPRLS